MSGQANKVAVIIFLALAGLLPACSQEQAETSETAAIENTEKETRSTSEADRVDKDQARQFEPVKKGVRVIVDDEVALLKPEVEAIERITPERSAEDKNAAEIARLPEKPKTFPRPLILAANDIRSGDVAVRLTGIKAPSKEKICVSIETAKRNWPCGNFAKAALQRLVRARTLSCEGDYVSETLFEGRCSVGKTDLSRWLVTQGWAEANGEEFRALMEDAKTSGKGLWKQ